MSDRIGKYVIVRTYSAGVFAGYIKDQKDRTIVLSNARRLWYWSGASSLSELAMKGTADSKNCKFPCAVDRVELLEVIEISDCTEKSRISIQGVDEWTQH